MSSFIRWLKSKNVVRLGVETVILLAFCTFTAFMLVNMIPIPTAQSLPENENNLKIISAIQRTESERQNEAFQQNEIVNSPLARPNVRVVLNANENSQVQKDAKIEVFEYDKCNVLKNYYQNEDENLKILKQTAVYNLKQYFNINNPEPFKNLCDVTFTVKTTKANHEQRLPEILDTWVKEVSSKVFIITDDNDDKFKQIFGSKLVVTNCEKSHQREGLVCKTAAEFLTYVENMSQWWCHADDDTYFNIKELYKLLETYDPRKPWYIGKISTSQPISIMINNKQISFSFATGGAGFCISLPLALQMMQYMNGSTLLDLSNLVGLPDDVLIGYIIESELKLKITNNLNFHSHLEIMAFYTPDDIPKQISLSYSLSNSNTIKVNKFKEGFDVSRFRTMHCFIFPQRKICNQNVL